jgi:hypothetical protein
MKHVLLVIPSICVLLTLPAFAQDTQPQND